MAIIERYGDARKFAETFNPNLQKYWAENIDQSFIGDAPTINALKSAYNEKQVRVWILAQLENINQFAGTKNKMEPPQMLMLADAIMTQYGYLKASELLLFFFQFKAGKFGQFYGSVDPLRISSALVEFISYRKEKIFVCEAKKENEYRSRRILEWEQKKAIEDNSDRL